MRTVYRLISGAVAVAAFFPVSMPAAYADQSTENAATGAWFWREQVSGAVPGAGVPYPAAIPLGLSGVPAGALAVAKTPDAPSDKETYLSWDLTTVPLDATITSFTFSVPMNTDPSAPQLDALGPLIQACSPKGGWGADEGAAYSIKPENDCSEPQIGVFDEATKSFKFDVTDYAKNWITLDNFGVALVPTPESNPFQVIFLDAASVKAVIAYDALPILPELPEVLPPPDTSGSVGGGDSSLGGFAPPVDPVPSAQPAPVVPAPVRPVTRLNALPAAHNSPNASFWLAALGVVALLGFTSLILGDPDVAPASTRAAAGTSSLSKALRERRVSSAPRRHTRARPV